jgi:hypothetical protein
VSATPAVAGRGWTPPQRKGKKIKTKGVHTMENIYIGNKVVKITFWNTDGKEIDYTRAPQSEFFLNERDGILYNRWGFAEKDNFGWNVTKEVTQEPKELLNTVKYVKALQEYGLTENEAITCLQKYANKISKTYKKTARDIYEEATYTYMSYDTPYPPKDYYNSFLDDIRGIDNSINQ